LRSVSLSSRNGNLNFSANALLASGESNEIPRISAFFF
jgi:hypothetical protein